MSVVPTAYCTDEDLASRCAGDYVVLCPAWQRIAAGSDGVFAVGDRWTLASASVDFLARGLAVGHVVLLKEPRAVFSGSGSLFGVAAVAAGSATLRRIGQAAGAGEPPASAGGLAGVAFEVRTLGPQIASATLDVKHQFGIDDNIAIRSSALVYDPNQELQQYTTLTVLQRQYAIECRTDRGDFALKLRQVESELGAMKSRMAVKFGSLGTGEQAHSMFGLRIRR